MKHSNDAIRNRTRNLPACSAVPQPSAPHRTPPTEFRRNLMLGNEVLEHHAYSVALLSHNFHIFRPFIWDNDEQGLWYSGLGSSTRKSLQMVYADVCINGSLHICLWRIFLTVAITSYIWASLGVGFIGTCLIWGRFLCGSWQVQAAYFVMKSDTSSYRPRLGTSLCTNFFTPLESPTGTALMA